MIDVKILKRVKVAAKSQKGGITTINSVGAQMARYLTKQEAASTYLSQADAASTYIPRVEFDDLFEKVNIGTEAAPQWAIRAKLSLYSDGWITAKGRRPDGSDAAVGATVLSALNDVALSSPLAAGQVLAYDAVLGKWVNKAMAASGLDEDSLKAYLTDNNYAKISDLPSLSGYATEQWVNAQGFLTRHQSLAGYLTKTAADAAYQPKGDYLTSVSWADVGGKPSWIGASKPSYSWGEIGGKPTTLQGYGITDGITASDAAAKYVSLDTAQTISGRKTFGSGIRVNNIDAVNGYGLLAYKPTDWIHVDSTQWGLGTTDAQGVIRSSNTDLLHCRNGASCKIWDSYNMGPGSGLNADLLDGYHFNRFVPKSIYAPSKGVLVTTSVPQSSDKMMIFRIVGHTYITKLPIDTIVQVYGYQGNTFVHGCAMLNNGHKLPYVKVFFADSVVKMWIPFVSSYNSLEVYCYDTMGGSSTNLVTALADSADVSSSGQAAQQIFPTNSAFITDTVAAAHRLVNVAASSAIEWDADAKAWKIDGNLYATGFITAKGQGAGGSASAGGLDLAALEAYLTQNKYATQSWVNGLGHITKAAADSAYQPKGNYLTSVSWADVGGKPTWIGASKPSYSWGEIGGKPTTLQGYGITDGITASDAAAKYVTLDTAQTISGRKTFGSGIRVNNIDAVNGYGLLAYKPTDWTHVDSTQWGLGTTDAQGVIRSSNTDLLHCRNGASCKIWDSYNMGPGSGLDADTLDGYHETAFVRSWWTASPGYDCAAHNSRPLISFTYSNNAYFTGAFMDVCVNGYGFYLGTQYNSDSPLYYRRHGTSGDGKMGEWQRLARLSEVYTRTEGDGRYARLASPNNMVHSTNEWTVIPDGYSQSTLWLNYGAGAGGTASNFNTLIIGNGTKGALASVKAKSFVVADGYSIGPGSTAHRMTTPHGYVDIGPMNTGYAHIYTDRPSFYFNKPLLINGGTVWHSSNDGSGSGLDADLLDGVHYRNILERHYTVTRSQDTAAKWYRVAKFLASNASGASGLLKIERSYYSPQNEGYIFAISLGYNGDINISQIAGVVGVQIITKMRVTCANSGEAYVDVYCGYTGYQNSLHVTAIGGLTALDITPDPATLAITKEYVPHRGMGSDMGFIGNASTATALRDRTNGTASYLNYGAAGLATASWLAAWNGYELRAISPSNVRSVIGAVAKAGDTMTGSLLMANGAATIGVSDGVANDNAYGLVNVTRNANDDNLSYYGFVVSGKHARGIGLNKSGNFVIGSASTSKVISPWLTISSAELVKTAANAAFKVSNGTSTIGLYNSTNRGVYDFTKDNWLIATDGTNTWLSVGYVGIGTTSPAYKLDVDGSIIAGSWVRTRGAAGWYCETYGGGWHMLDSTWLRSYNNKPLYVSQGTGIGASGFCVGAHLHGDSHSSIEVSGGAYTMGLGCHSNGGWYWWRGTANPTSSYANKSYVMEYNGTTWKFTGILHATTGIYSDGYITAKTGSSSDARLKDIIGSPSLTLEQVAASPLVRFRWKKDGGIAIGTIAQHWLNVLEEVVYKDPDGYYAVQYGVLADAKATVVARAVLGHERRIEALERRIEALERENREMETEVKRLRKAA